MSATLVATTNEVNLVSNINTYTTIAPMATLLQQEYARVTAFAIAECEVDCGNTVTYGQTGCIELPRLGDLMTSSFFRIDRKGLRAVPVSVATPGDEPNANNVNISCVPSWAHALFAFITFEVGGQIVDKLTSDILQMIEELASPSGNEQGAMIGDFEDLESIRQQTFNDTTYFMAARFFYFDSVEMAVPLIAWSAHQIRFRYQLNDMRTLFNITITGGTGESTPANIGDFVTGTTYTDADSTVWQVDSDNNGAIEKISYIARIICATQAERACIAGDIIETLFTQFQYEDYDSVPLGQTSKTTLMSYNNLGLMSCLRFRADFYTDYTNCNTKDYFDYTLARYHTDFTSFTPVTGAKWNADNERPTWFTGSAQLYRSPIDRWTLTNNGQLRYDITRDWGKEVVPFLYAVKKPRSHFLTYAWHLSPLVGASAPSGTSINWSRINQPIERAYFNTAGGSSIINADNLNVSRVSGTAPSGNIPGALFHCNKSFNVSKTVAGHLQIRFA